MGSLCVRRVLNKKWGLSNKGPYKVIKKNYTLQRSPHAQSFIAHVDRLTQYAGEVPECWANVTAGPSKGTAGNQRDSTSVESEPRGTETSGPLGTTTSARPADCDIRPVDRVSQRSAAALRHRRRYRLQRRVPQQHRCDRQLFSWPTGLELLAPPAWLARRVCPVYYGLGHLLRK